MTAGSPRKTPKTCPDTACDRPVDVADLQSSLAQGLGLGYRLCCASDADRLGASDSGVLDLNAGASTGLDGLDGGTAPADEASDFVCSDIHGHGDLPSSCSCRVPSHNAILELLTLRFGRLALTPILQPSLIP